MKTIAALLLAMGTLGVASAGTNVGVTIDINQPGVYGRINIGNAPPPMVVYPQPVIISPQPVVVAQPPLYLYVPPGHQKHWAKYCSRYNACGHPVYFVQEKWVVEQRAMNREHGRGRDHDQKDGDHGRDQERGDHGNHARKDSGDRP